MNEAEWLTKKLKKLRAITYYTGNCKVTNYTLINFSLGGKSRKQKNISDIKLMLSLEKVEG